MPQGFHISKEGIEAYEKIGLAYDRWFWDDVFEQWKKDTTDDPELMKKHGQGLKPVEVLSIKRHDLGDGQQVITYNKTEYRLDQAFNLTHRNYAREGEYPIPVPRWKVLQLPFGKTERIVDDVDHIETGYSIPFSPEAVDKIIALGEPRDRGIQYYLIAKNGIAVSIQTEHDFKFGKFEELVHFRKIPTEDQRRRWLEDQGLEKDAEMFDERHRKITMGDVPERNITASEVEKLLKRERERIQEEEKERIRKEKDVKAAAKTAAATKTKKKSK
jgi:hypothetical protein